MEYFIVGFPLKRPKSPEHWNNFFIKTGRKSRMQELELEPKNFLTFKEEIKKRKFKAIVVTMPYKKKLLNICDTFDISASTTRSTNLIINQYSNLIAYNTDVLGFELSLLKKNINMNGFDNFVIYGYGGTGEALAKYISKKFKKFIFVITSKNLKDTKYIKFFKKINKKLNNTLIINCTPIGSTLSKEKLYTSPFSKKFLDSFTNSFVYDINYKISKKNDLKKICIKKNFKYMNGLYMNKIQAKEAIKITFPE